MRNLFIFLLSLIAVTSYSQTVIGDRIIARQQMILPVFSDTNQANVTFGVKREYNMINVTPIPLISEIYIRSSNNTRWIKIGEAGAGAEVDPAAWLKLGNSGTDSTNNFVGTIDIKPLNVRTGNVQRFSFASDRSEIQTYTNVTGSMPYGGGFYVNGGNLSHAAMTYPGANMAISGGHTGNRALGSITTGYWNYAIGDLALNTLTTGTQNIGIGYKAMNLNVASPLNIAIGYEALRANTNTTGLNTAIGNFAMAEYASHYASVAIGGESQRYVNGGHDNVGVGFHSVRGNGNISVNYTVGIGSATCQTCGNYNTAIGTYNSTQLNVNGIENVSVGAFVNGSYGNGPRDAAKGNVALGYGVGFEGITGDDNVIAGRYGGAYNNNGHRISGSRNTLLGAYTSSYTQGSDANIALGAWVANPAGIGADATLNIGNVIYGSNMYSGTTGSSTPVVGGKIGVRVKLPLATLHIDSDTANVSGLRFEKLTSASPTSTGATLGVDVDGKVITVAGGGGGSTYTASSGVVLQGSNFKIQDTLNGAGTKLMWHSASTKGAFRAGYVNGTQWDIDSIGQYSTAFGINNKVTGYAATAFGNSNTVVSSGSFVIGNSNTVKGSAFVHRAVFIAGQLNVADAENASVLGGSLYAKSTLSTVIGHYNDSAYTPGSGTVYNVNNRVFEIGIGMSEQTRKNGMTMWFTGKLNLGNYGVGTFTGTPAKNLAVTSTGDVIEVSPTVLRLTTAQRLSLVDKEEGDIVYDKGFHRFYFWNGTVWRRFN